MTSDDADDPAAVDLLRGVGPCGMIALWTLVA